MQVQNLPYGTVFRFWGDVFKRDNSVECFDTVPCEIMLDGKFITEEIPNASVWPVKRLPAKAQIRKHRIIKLPTKV